MRSEALDITIESRGHNVWLRLSGPFHNEQVPNIRQEIMGMVRDGNRYIVIDMERVTGVDAGVVPAFLEIMNAIRGKDGDLRFIFKNETVSKAFAPYRNLFAIYPDAQLLAAGGFFQALRRQSRVLLKKTGVRISGPVALFVLAVLVALFLSLGYIIVLQNRQVRQQTSQIHELTQWKQETAREVDMLRERLKPIEQLGLLPDTNRKRPR